ncbi:MAG: hypothetical protein WCA81_04550 [Rhizomicrobium sp.]
MQPHVLRVVWRAEAHKRAHHELIGRRLQRFRPEVRHVVRALAACHSRLADLVVSFPALAVALAKPRAHFDPEPVIADVIAGARLVELGQAAGVPLWLRALPPEAFTGRLPVLPNSNAFGSRIANHLPRSPGHAALWLEAVGLAADLGTEDLAVWFAREFMRDKKSISSINHARVRQLSLWAWYSGRPGTRAHALIDRPWNPDMRMRAAVTAADNWRSSIDAVASLGDESIADIWFKPANVDGYEFVPLATASDIIDEGRIMKNCVRTYGANAAHDYCRLWSIRRTGGRVATLRISHYDREPVPNVAELELASNRQAPKEIWCAVYKWIAGQDLMKFQGRDLKWGSAPLDHGIWRDLWKPYWLAKKRIPFWLPLTPTRGVIDCL